MNDQGKKSQKKEEIEKKTRSLDVLTVDGEPAADFLIVGVGASAGGFEAFQTFLKNIPATTGMAFVLIMHLDPTHESLMPELLNPLTEMNVQQVKSSIKAKPNNVYIIPPNKTLTIEKGVLRLNPPAVARGLRLPIDAFFHSLAEDQRENAVGIILSGSGSDGAIGMKTIKENGGVIFAQEIETAKHDGMPRSAILTGLVDFILPVDEIPARLVEYSKHRETLHSRNEIKSEMAAHVDEICAILRRETGHDFSNYKRNTLVRRIQRRIQVVQANSVSDYVSLIRSDKNEVENLFKDLLISVTHFFRDRDAFEALKDRVIPSIVDGKSEGDFIRIWVPGCATGEEAYSIAMLLCERMTELGVRIPTQIFATDIDEDALERARAGRYPVNIAEQIPKHYLETFFIKHGGFYQVSKSLREMCLFSTHNLIKHPPFSRLDLVSCRNLLIYLDSELQKKVLPVFHYALRPNGYLFLGTSESVAGYSDLFRTMDKSNRVFQANDTILGKYVTFPITDSSVRTNQQFSRRKIEPKNQVKQVGQIIENILLENYAPACVIVNERAEIVYYFGRTGKYLEPATGAPTNNVLDLARKGLRLDLRTALHKAIGTKEEVTHENITVETSEQMVQRINLQIHPMQEFGEDSNLFLVVFEDFGNPFSPEKTDLSDSIRRTDEPAIKQLESELRATKEHLQTTIEELETSNEELKSSNEELLSMNEELQSSNEELQTSKEEMQSINEELETVNAELRKKVEELDAANSDLQNFFQSTNIATIFLDRNLRIKKFTPATTGILNLIETDIGRPLTDIMPRLEGVDLQAEVAECLKTLQTLEREVNLADRKEHFIMRIAPYRTLDNMIDGVVIIFVNVSEIRTAREEAEKRARRQSAIAELGLFAVQNSDLQSILDKSTALGKEILETDFIKILKLLPDGKELLLVSGLGWHDGLKGSAKVGADLDSQAGYTLRANAPVVVKDLGEEIRFHGPKLLIDHRVVSGMSVVIYGDDKPFGVLGAHTLAPRDFTQDEANFLQSFANIVSAAVQRERIMREIRESEERLALALNAGRMGTWEWNLDTDEVIWSRQLYRILGYDNSKAGLSSEEFFARVHPDDLPDLRNSLEGSIRQNSDFYHEFRIFKANDGAVRWLVGQGKIIESEQRGSSVMVGVNYDITERKIAENKLVEANERKNDFLAMLGHELRNPLAPLKNSLTIIKGDTTPEQFQTLHEIMNRQINQLSRLVDDLLDASRISHGKIHIERKPLELRGLLTNLTNDSQSLIENKKINLELTLPDEEVWIVGDAVRLNQAFANLLTNAIKFSDFGGSVYVTLAAANMNAVLTFKDEGIGISPEAIERIFESFIQEDNSLERSRGGLGLGLPLAKGLIEMHHGTITAASDGENRGSVFVITLEMIQNPAVIADPVGKKSRGPNRQRRVLIIEDNIDSAGSLKLFLELSNYIVETAPDGKTGIAAAAEFAPEIIICDIGLPGGMNGYDVVKHLKKDSRFKSVHFVALSGYGQTEDKEKSIEVGFEEHLVKPVDPDYLCELLESLS